MLSRLQDLVQKTVEVPVIGVDLGSSSIKIVEIVRAKDQVKLRKAVAVSTGTHNPATLLRQILQEYGIKTKEAALGLSSPELIVRPFSFPEMSRKELRGAVMIEAEQAVLGGHSLSEMAVSWYTVENNTAAAGPKSISGVMAVVPQKIMEEHLKVIEAAQLNPRVLDVKGLALWNAYWTLTGYKEAAGQTVLLIHLGNKTTQLVIARGARQLILVRDLEMGAEFLQDGGYADWTLEVMNSIAYAKSRGDLKELDNVYVTGGGAQPDILPLLQPLVSAPVALWNPFESIFWDTDALKINTSDGPKFSIAIGLALRRP